MEFVDTSIVEPIEMKMIRPSQFAVREKFHKLSSNDDDALVSSIKEHGLLQPILIRPITHGFEIVAGHRRFHACKSLRWRHIPCKIREMSDKQAYEIQLTENIQRKTMEPIEEAEAFRRYVIDFGWGGVSELAKKIGMSEVYVSHRIQLLKLPDDIKEQIFNNRLNVSQALELTNLPFGSRTEIMNHVVNNNLTVRQIREVKSFLKEVNGCESDSIHQKALYKSLSITKKTSLALKITLARIDNIIEEAHTTIEPEQRTEITNFLMGLRLKVHAMIDDTIRFKNSSRKSLKN
ncbi:MAG TPA: ParB/RepB/Spo0J family partition protein [Nitrososphaeraceae archaeon]|jgi:ParB family transcriptional regulator, chromosome partitioning protein|nr:ParB/RepB/Spo0J family partition protein [Nitrososphaeraceae archaeon]